MERLVQEDILMETSMGTVEYWVKGTGPTMVVCHGGPGWYDQGKLIADIADTGYQVLCFSRPGYLRTPLVHGTIKAQARLLNTLHRGEIGIGRS
ncbi:hypothetical protein GF325_01555 [Candidatus Bathyarchaeota archaeon]|nr:hypothetical protein [Candidatus Bathyarchaeota archaeon]